MLTYLTPSIISKEVQRRIEAIFGRAVIGEFGAPLTGVTHRINSDEGALAISWRGFYAKRDFANVDLEGSLDDFYERNVAPLIAMLTVTLSPAPLNEDR